METCPGTLQLTKNVLSFVASKSSSTESVGGKDLAYVKTKKWDINSIIDIQYRFFLLR